MQELKEKNREDLVQEYKESYEILINVLDEIVKIFRDENITINQYANILKQGLKS